MKVVAEKKRHFIVYVDVYKQDILFCLNMTNQEAFNVLKKINPEIAKESKDTILEPSHEASSVEGTMYPLSKGYLVLLKTKKDSFRHNLCIAIHEICHVAHYILRKVRIPLNEDTEEAYTYLVETITRGFLGKFY